jgi:hypothetical protein
LACRSTRSTNWSSRETAECSDACHEA